MKKFIAENKILVALVLLSLGLFYWFQLRPTMIRKSCFEKANSYYDSYIDSYPDSYSSAERYKVSTYKECFLENGLKPEQVGL